MKPRYFAAFLLIAAYCAIGIFLVGCASARKTAKPTPMAAYVATEGARLQIAKARAAAERIKSAADAPVAQELKSALENADRALAEAGGKIETVQYQMEEISKAKNDADEREKQADEARRFWRAWTLRLSGICLAFGLWTFRKPLLVVAGL